jgi:serine/threonine-protein phosphatase 2A regulatory subunit B'
MDFAEQAEARDKELKRQNLLEIMDYINSTKNVFNEQTFPEIIHMISQNLFRGLAPSNQPPYAQYDPEEDEPVLEPAWPHLQYVYEFLLRFVVSNETDPKVRLGRLPLRTPAKPLPQDELYGLLPTSSS